MPATEITAVLNRAADQWDRTEILIKKVEMLDREVLAPAINELRYAGRRLIDAVRASQDLTKTSNEVLAYVLEVEQFCFRAQHDCIDAMVTYQHDVLTLMETSFGYDLMLKHFPNYITLRSELTELGHIVISSRGERGNRVALYNDIEANRLPIIVKFIQELHTSEDVLKAIAAAERKKDDDHQDELKAAKNTLKWTRIGVAVAVLVAIVAVAQSFYESKKNEAKQQQSVEPSHIPSAGKNADPATAK